MSHIKHRKKGKGDVLIDAGFRIKIEKAINEFALSDEMVYEFPSTLTNVERAFVHNLAPRFNLKTKSNGNGAGRKLSLYKLVEQDDCVCPNASIVLSSQSRACISDYFKNHGSEEEATSKAANTAVQSIQGHCPAILRNPPSVPSSCRQSDYNIQKIRKNLPIFTYKDKIMDIIERNRVILIHGSTGSGKTTQLPQYIMDLAAQRNEPCRILCTQPRRISAISSAERVCYERGVDMGTSIGYQIRLDSKLQSNTNCVFLTPGVFLRYLMAIKPAQVFTNLTHCIIDEAHEHAKENDFLLTSIREHMDVNPNLKLIIMSATMDTQVFAKYFGGYCEEISIFSKQFEVEEFYLEDVLKMVNFTNQRVEELKKKYQSGELIRASKSAYVNEGGCDDDYEEGEVSVNDLDNETKSFLDEILENMSTGDNDENHINQFLYLVQNENIPVNYRHSQTQMTALMIAVGRGWKGVVESLLNLKADPTMKVNFGGREMTCLDIANEMFGVNSEVKEILLKFQSSKGPSSNEDSFNKALVNIYQDSILKSKSNNFIVEEVIDHELIIQLVEKIHFGYENTNGAILIFLPGFDDIIQLSDLIHKRIRQGYTLFMLHSSMKTEDQKNVFKPTYQGKRKIILSTNIAESSITIDDVVYVIDSGREKQKSFDAISHSSSLRVQWISKASANQRRGRAGRLRNGIVYRIYSRDRFQSMLDVTIPELLRTSLSEVCLQTKLLISNSTSKSIEEFLLKCIACPSAANIRQSIKYLQKIGALDENENLTLFGSHLAQMPIDTKYGKMLIYSIVFKCFDPILSLVSILSMGEQIFLLPITPGDRAKCIEWRKTVAGESHSDHFMMLKIFQTWMNLKNNREDDYQFCRDNFISRNHIEHVRGIRRQILSYLEQSELISKNNKTYNENSENWSLLKAVICAGLYPFIARVERQRGNMFTEIDTKLTFHMSSVLSVKKAGYKSVLRKLPVEWVIFEEKQRIGRMSMLKCNTLVNSVTASLMSGTSLMEEKYVPFQKGPNPTSSGWDDDEWEDMHDDYEEYLHEVERKDMDFKVDGLLKFFASNDDAKNVFELKNRINSLVMKYLSDRKFKASNADNMLIQTVAKVIENQEENSRMAKMDISENSLLNVQQSYQQNQQRSYKNDNYQRNYNQQGHASSSSFYSNQNRFSDANSRPRGNSSQYYQNQQHGNRQNNASQSQTFYQQSSSHQNQQFYQNRYAPRQPRQKMELSSSQKFILVKVNSKKYIDDLAGKIVVSLNELNLKIWQQKKIEQCAKNGTHVHIIFYSTHKSEFQGYGDVVVINESHSHSMQFHYRARHTLRLEVLAQTSFYEEILMAVTNPSFYFHELNHITGNSLILYLQ